MSKISIALLLSLFLLSCSDEGSSNITNGTNRNRNRNDEEDRSINADFGGNDISDISDADGDGFLDGVLADVDGDGSADDRVRASDGLPGVVAPSNSDD